jgi:hypothetical protein
MKKKLKLAFALFICSVWILSTQAVFARGPELNPKAEDDRRFFFDPSESRNQLSITDSVYRIRNQYLEVRKGKESYQIKTPAIGDYNILSVSPDQKYLALFEHYQSYGSGKMHLVDLAGKKIIKTINASLGDLHWTEPDRAVLSYLSVSCDNCDTKTYSILLAEIELTTGALTDIATVTENEAIPSVVEVIEKTTGFFTYSITPFKKDRNFKKYELEDRNLRHLDSSQLLAAKLGLAEPTDHRLEELPSSRGSFRHTAKHNENLIETKTISNF